MYFLIAHLHLHSRTHYNILRRSSLHIQYIRSTSSIVMERFLKRKPTSNSLDVVKRHRSEWQWETINEAGMNLLLIGSHCDTLIQSTKVAAFDLDGTVIMTKSGKAFPKDESDWKIRHNAAKKIRDAHHDGFHVVIFSNQGGIPIGKVSLPSWKSKLESISTELDVPFLVLASIGVIDKAMDVFRKPSHGMWLHLVFLLKNMCLPASAPVAGPTWSSWLGGPTLIDAANEMADSSTYDKTTVEIDLSSSYYVGDAAGRPAVGKCKKDHSASDRQFALNAGLTFYTPEEFFDGCSTQAHDTFDPTLALNVPAFIFPDSQLLPEMIINVGYMGSGKTTYTVRELVSRRNYIHVNRDILKTADKCLAAAKDALCYGNSVVIDNTNGTVADRAKYIKIAQAAKVPIRCLHFTTSLEQSRHNDKVRQTTCTGYTAIPKVVFYTFRKKYVAPSKEEGFDDILEIPFSASFSDKASLSAEQQRLLYSTRYNLGL